MVKWIKLTQTQYFGLFALGLLFFGLQQLPYIIMPLIPTAANPLMEMQDNSAILNASEKILGVSCVLSMLFLVREDSKWFSLSGRREAALFSVAMLAIAAYFVGWIFYFSGFQSLALILCLLVSMPPVYYTFIGLWRKNYVLAALGILFLTAHILNVWNNLKA